MPMRSNARRVGISPSLIRNGSRRLRYRLNGAGVLMLLEPDFERSELSAEQFFLRFHGLDFCDRRSHSAPVGKLLEVHLRAFRDDFHAPIVQVAHPARERVPDRLLLGGPPIIHALDAPVHAEMKSLGHFRAGGE